VRAELGLGVNAFLETSGLSKTTYYARKRGRRPRLVTVVNNVASQPKQEEIAPEVQQLCDAHPELGSPTIAAFLNKDCKKAGESTVLRLMKRKGMLPKPYRRKRKKPTPTEPPDLTEVGMMIGLDFTHWQGKPICNVIEYEARYCLASVVYARETAETAQDALAEAFREAARLGLPTTKVEIKSDHGATFTAETFEKFIIDKGCWHTLSAVGRPQGMGRVERYNRNVKEQRLRWADEMLSASDLQDELDQYRKFYNEVRPHRALDGSTPIDFLQAAFTISVPRG
jgi:putative transposase